MTYEEAEALIREHMDYGGNVKVHALATALSEARRTVSGQEAGIDALRRDIMNIPCKEPEHYQDAAVRMAYRVGHRDARHAAFDIVGAAPIPATEPNKGV